MLLVSQNGLLVREMPHCMFIQPASKKEFAILSDDASDVDCVSLLSVYDSMESAKFILADCVKAFEDGQRIYYFPPKESVKTVEKDGVITVDLVKEE